MTPEMEDAARSRLLAQMRAEFPGIVGVEFIRKRRPIHPTVMAIWNDVGFEIVPTVLGGPLRCWVFVGEASAFDLSFREALAALDQSDLEIRRATETLLAWRQISEGDTVSVGGAPAVVGGGPLPVTTPGVCQIRVSGTSTTATVTDSGPSVEPCVPDAKVWCERCGWLGREVECYTATAGCVCPSCGSMWEITEGRPLNGMRATSGVRFNASADSWVDEVWPDDLQRGRRYTGSRPASVLSEAVERTDERLRVWRAEDIQQILNERDEARSQRDAVADRLNRALDCVFERLREWAAAAIVVTPERVAELARQARGDA